MLNRVRILMLMIMMVMMMIRYGRRSRMQTAWSSEKDDDAVFIDE